MTGDRDDPRGSARQAGQPGLHPRITVSGYVSTPVEASFSAPDLARRLAELGEQAAAAVSLRIARGELLHPGELGSALGWEGHAGDDLGGPLAVLADACERHASELGLDFIALQESLDRDPEDITVTVTRAPARAAAGDELAPAAAAGSPLSGPGIRDVHPDDRAAFAAAEGRARELTRAFVRAGFRAAPGDRNGVELHPDDAARLLAAVREPGIGIGSVPAAGGRAGAPQLDM